MDETHLRLFKHRYMIHPDCGGEVINVCFVGRSEERLCPTHVVQAGVEHLEFGLICLCSQVLLQTTEGVQKTLTSPLREKTNMCDGGQLMSILQHHRPAHVSLQHMDCLHSQHLVKYSFTDAQMQNSF